MLTCKELHAAGMPHLLRRGVDIKNISKLHSFCRFILRNAPLRAVHVRKLILRVNFDAQTVEVGPTPLEEHGEEEGALLECYTDAEIETLSLLKQVLGSTSNLEELRVDLCEELLQLDEYVSDLQDSDHQLAMTLSSSRSFKRLHLSSLGFRAQVVLSTMLAPLAEVVIDFYCNSDYDDVLTALEPHKATLRSITAYHIAVDARQPPQSVPVYPRVLFLSLHHIASLTLNTLLHGFPALRTLELFDLTFRTGISHPAVALRNRETPDGMHWPELTILRGDLFALDALGLTRHVPTLEITRTTLHPSDFLALTGVLHGTRPRYLFLHIGHHCILPARHTSVDDAFTRLLEVPGWFEITHFALDVCAPLFEGVTAGWVGTLVSHAA